MGAIVGPKFFFFLGGEGALDPCPLRWGVSDLSSPTSFTAANLSFKFKRLVRNYGDLPEKFDPSRHTFQCHWNRDGSIGHFLLVFHSNYGPISKGKGAIFAKKIHPVCLTPR